MPKILFIGFGIEPYCIGGAVLYQDSLSKALNRDKWEVVCFFAAPRYMQLYNSQPFIKTWFRDGIKFIELINSPHSFGYLNNPDTECNFKKINKFTEAILNEEKPDLVHIHELQLHSASIIDLIVKKEIPVIKTMHNYYDICSQRDLMFKSSERCVDFKDGIKCVSCLEKLPRNKYNLYINNKSLILKLYSALLKRKYKLIQKITGIKPIPFTPLQFTNRRKYFVDHLNKLNIIHCSSQGAAEIFIRYGISQNKIHVLPIATESIEIIRSKPIRKNHKNPVVFGYIGDNFHHKGYNILIKAFSKLDQSKAKLIIWSNRVLKFNSNLNIECKKKYTLENINEAFSEIDIGIIPSVWDEIFGLIGVEWIKAKIPIIGSNIGGIPQWLIDQENGLLIKPNDIHDLFDKMELFVKSPELISNLQKKMIIRHTFKDHVNSMINLYNDLLKTKK